ncbi:MAG: hypothetical protein VR65_08705 [Desulfobulbaceae bacterium BRH_c16a]|nr:MAG: hypothetical protein VR65_08705 [Desulfobulbaceae bacterium BRH_c16a]
MSAIGAISTYQSTPGVGVVGALSGRIQAAGKASSEPGRTDVVTISQEAQNAAAQASNQNEAQVDTSAGALAAAGQRAMTSGASVGQMQQYAAAMSAYY